MIEASMMAKSVNLARSDEFAHMLLQMLYFCSAHCTPIDSVGTTRICFF